MKNSNRKIAFIGFGALCYQITNMLIQSGFKKENFIYFDDIAYKQKLGNVFKFDEYLNETFKNYEFCISLGYKHLIDKHRIIEKLENKNLKLFTYIHQSCHIDSTAIISQGVIIYPMCNIDYNVKINKGVLLNNSVTISHDSNINECCYVSPGVILSGKINIGKYTFLGTGTKVANNVNIGKNCTIGIGSVITKDLKNDTIGIGNPFCTHKNIKIT